MTIVDGWIVPPHKGLTCIISYRSLPRCGGVAEDEGLWRSDEEKVASEVQVIPTHFRIIQWLSSGYPDKKGLTADPRTVPVVSPQTDAMPCLKCPRSLQKWLAIPGLPSRFPVALRAAPFVPTCGKATKGRLGWVKQLDGSPERDVKDRMGRDSFFLIFLPRILGQVT